MECLVHTLHEGLQPEVDDENNSDSDVVISESRTESSPESKPTNLPVSNASWKNKPRAIILSGSDSESSEDNIVASKQQPRSLRQIQSDSE
ncbi:hypothetical protein DSO57_1039056 [Entomophthora muscae]|uniref:Uncharacterized protein n=1 Tax=Entomophthora muscae TaxID=34485 RepID=A0ACC2SMM4_9FUNG|nr:hypothetical protein DSO57_1039056 [Entomophthora muscae]